MSYLNICSAYHISLFSMRKTKNLGMMIEKLHSKRQPGAYAVGLFFLLMLPLKSVSLKPLSLCRAT
jgi:hypothetical protein